jgi:two-component system sensor histidine kinase/response regulator
MASNNILPFSAVSTVKTQQVLSTSREDQYLIKDRSCDILVVDDNPNILATMSACLEKKGFSITKASDGRTALETIKKNYFDLVITDLNMPGANGLVVLKEAKMLNPDTIVIIASGDQDFESVVEAFHFGADGYLLKPFGVNELYTRIDQCFKKLEQKKRSTVSEDYLRALNEQILTMLMIVSHDIRSPLVAIAATLKLLIRGVYGKIDESPKETLKDLYGRVNRLNGIAEDYLGKASVVIGEVQMERKKLDLREDIIDPILDELSSEIERRGIIIDNRLGAIPANQISTKADRIWLKVIFRNLFCNAIQYGGSGCTISFGFEKHATHYKLNVYNNGKPIPEECQSHLFTKFTRISEGNNGNSHGTGLGLYLIKEIIQKHGGDIWYEAKENGSNFVFTLPCD